MRPLAERIREHAELMIEQATERLDSGPADRDRYDNGRDQGIKDACRVLLLVVDDGD